MNKLETLKIKNFRSCVDTKFDFRQSLTALIGVNAAGKTNILKAITMLSKNSAQRRRIRGDFSIEGSTPAKIEANITLSDQMISIKAEFYQESDEDLDDIAFSSIAYKIDKKSTWIKIESVFFEYASYITARGYADVEKFILRDAGKTDLGDVDMKVRIINYLTSISYYSATQFSDPSKCPNSLTLDDRYSIHSRNGSHGHERFLRDLFSAYQQGDRFHNYVSIVGEDGIGLIEKIEFEEYSLPNNSYKVSTGGTIKNVERKNRIVVPTIRLDGLQLSFSQLSEGTFKTLALIFYIVSDTSNLMIVEEPEVCVHHGLLSSIIELIKAQSATKQIIISTHSDYVLDKLKPENVVLVEKSKDLGTKASPLAKALYNDDYSALKEYLNESGNLGEYWRESGFKIEKDT